MIKLLDIQNLNASINNTQIIKDFNLIVNESEIHVIMGPNGCGKSTLSKVLAGHPSYEVNSGNIEFSQKDLDNYMLRSNITPKNSYYKRLTNVQIIKKHLMEFAKCFQSPTLLYKQKDLIELANLLS